MATFKQLSLAAVVTLLGGCASETLHVTNPPVIGKASVVSLLQDRLFGSHAVGAFQRTFPVANVNWQSNEVITRRVGNAIAKSGGEIVSTEYNEDLLAKVDPQKMDLSVFQQIALELAKTHTQDHVTDVVIIYPVAINMYGNVSNPLGYFFTWGIAGVLSERSYAYHPAYLIKMTEGMEEKLSGKSSCIVSFGIGIVDVATNQVKAQRQKVFGREELPNTLWAERFEDFSPDEKETIKATCLRALVKGGDRALAEMGFGSNR